MKKKHYPEISPPHTRCIGDFKIRSVFSGGIFFYFMKVVVIRVLMIVTHTMIVVYVWVIVIWVIVIYVWVGNPLIPPHSLSRKTKISIYLI